MIRGLHERQRGGRCPRASREVECLSSRGVARVGAAEAVATVRVTYAEARAALAHHRREGGLTPVGLRRAVRELDREWGMYNIVDVNDPLVRRGALAERYGLRGYDAVQLAAALDLRAAGAPVEFLSFDSRLNRAARRERLFAHST